MIQGWTGVKEDWNHLPFQLLKEQNRAIITFDNRGIGQSQVKIAGKDTAAKPNENKGQPEFLLEDLCEDTHNLIAHVFKAKRCVHDKIDLLGFSMGGMIAQKFLLKYPLLIRKIILLGTAPGK
ncbi:alpha/beta hydrolase fold protein [Reticulomyxa filosa]|uniref:Alpha/beta hydrolase fold protein n=1 Tax=Reticulomyxa filosa TaxID=46433 RepID=X6NC89_RETFI|nr:alpha/beta hydrolase fold protein [Reticulomyxa filosa]|eukprot:ETO23518.1 alpha/beta hydrolase fold protein [Reticulomyxa filosa]